MTQSTAQGSMMRLRRYLDDYRPRLEQALRAIQVLETSDAESEEFAQALADLQVCATILEPYSEGVANAIEQYTEEQPEGE
jgi:ABC-type transporter Mla subunit MlaD